MNKLTLLQIITIFYWEVEAGRNLQGIELTLNSIGWNAEQSSLRLCHLECCFQSNKLRQDAILFFEIKPLLLIMKRIRFRITTWHFIELMVNSIPCGKRQKYKKELKEWNGLHLVWIFLKENYEWKMWKNKKI